MFFSQGFVKSVDGRAPGGGAAAVESPVLKSVTW